jgi:hypothetical protein
MAADVQREAAALGDPTRYPACPATSQTRQDRRAWPSSQLTCDSTAGRYLAVLTDTGQIGSRFPATGGCRR